MQPAKNVLAEDSCFIKYHGDDVDGGAEKGGGAAVREPDGLPDGRTEKDTLNGVDRGEGAVDANDPEKGHSPARGGADSDAATAVDEAVDEKDDFPEGGLRAWLVVVGAFCGSFSVFGIINSTAVILEYVTKHQLQDYTESQIGWIFGLGLFLTFFCGAPIGPIFDSYGPRILIFLGSLFLLASIFLLGLCTQYWHFFMVYSVLNGIGGCLVNTPCIASIGHFFYKRRANATGIAMTAGSIGGIIIPLMLQKLFPAVGFAWATRILGFMLLFLLLLANTFVRSRLPRRPMASLSSIVPDLTLFKDVPFLLMTVGIFLMEWGLFIPLTYITSYSNAHGHSTEFGFQILSIFNAGSFFGRLGAGIVADMIGRMNTLILSLALCVISCFALWLPAADSMPMLIVCAVIFGFVSGSNLSLSPVCVGQFCKTENYGRYFATCWMFVAFGTLTGLPIAGQILASNGGEYWGLITFAGMSYVGALLCLVVARVMKVGWKINVIY